ncbi:MAG TPA: DUF3147 family protein [Anaerolineaceae bacterium]
MGIQVKPSAVKQTRWYEYLIRFVFGGLITIATGLVTKHYGPVVGGLFLAFPAIFPASVTLVQSHKKREEEAKGEDEEQSKEKGIRSAGDIAEGTVYGSFGLAGFGVIIWQLAGRPAPAPVLLLALLAWLAVGIFVWWLVGKLLRRD